MKRKSKDAYSQDMERIRLAMLQIQKMGDTSKTPENRHGPGLMVHTEEIERDMDQIKKLINVGNKSKKRYVKKRVVKQVRLQMERLVKKLEQILAEATDEKKSEMTGVEL